MLVATVRQLVALGLGAVTPVLTVSAAMIGGFSAGWTIVLVLIEAIYALALVTVIVIRHRQ